MVTDRDTVMCNRLHPLPRKLGKEPLLEAVWEVRFSGAPSVGELLPGVLFKALGGKYEEAERLPTADIPAAATENDPVARYHPRIRLQKANRAVLIGPHVIALSCRRPYAGWSQFSSEIQELARAVEESGLVRQLERCSLKYLDLVQLEDPQGLACLDAQIRLGPHQIQTTPLQLRAEIRENAGGWVHVVHIIWPAEVRAPDQPESLRGLLLDIDTIRPLGEGASWAEMSRFLEDLHAASKRTFFTLLAPQTIEALQPQYEDG